MTQTAQKKATQAKGAAKVRTMETIKAANVCLKWAVKADKADAETKKEIPENSSSAKIDSLYFSTLRLFRQVLTY